MSLPRDSLVTIPEYVGTDGTTLAARQAKLNAAFAEGGGALLVRTIEDATDIRINHYLEVDFEGFLNIVDALGGVEVCLPEAAVDPKAGLDLPAGRQTVDGPQALAYVRTRSLDATADIGRIQRQQKFLAAMVQKATSAGTLLNPLAFDRLASAAAESLTTDETLDAAGLMNLAQRMRGVDPKSVTFLTVPVADYNYRVDALGSTLLWDEVQAEALFAKIRADEPLVDPAAPKVTVLPGGHHGPGAQCRRRARTGHHRAGRPGGHGVRRGRRAGQRQAVGRDDHRHQVRPGVGRVGQDPGRGPAVRHAGGVTGPRRHHEGPDRVRLRRGHGREGAAVRRCRGSASAPRTRTSATEPHCSRQRPDRRSRPAALPWAGAGRR